MPSSITSPPRLAAVGIELTGVLTDNGPEFTGTAFTAGMADRRHRPRAHATALAQPQRGLRRFQGIALDESSRPAFHRQHFTRILDLGQQLQGWLDRYNTRRRNHGDFMHGRTPATVLNQHPNKAA